MRQPAVSAHFLQNFKISKFQNFNTLSVWILSTFVVRPRSFPPFRISCPGNVFRKCIFIVTPVLRCPVDPNLIRPLTSAVSPPQLLALSPLLFFYIFWRSHPIPFQFDLNLIDLSNRGFSKIFCSKNLENGVIGWATEFVGRVAVLQHWHTASDAVSPPTWTNILT